MNLITTPTQVGYTPAATSIVHSTTASLTSRFPVQPVHLVQYDQTMPVIAVALTANGQPYTVPSGAAVNVRMNKPDGTFVYNPALGLSSDGQTAYIGITAQMTAAAGNSNPIVEIVVNEGVAGTAAFPVIIDQNPVPDRAIESSDEWLTIEQILQQVEEAAAVVQQNAQNLQNLTDNLEAVQNAAANAQAAAASAAAAQQAAQEALGFRTFFSAVTPDENGDLDPSRPMTTPTAASVTIKSKGDRIQSVQVNGFTQQAGSGDPSHANVRAITVAAQDGTLPITLTGGQTVTESLKLTAPLCDGDKVESCVPSWCDKTITIDGSTVAVTASGSNYVVTAADAAAGGNAYAEDLAYLSLTAGQIAIPAASFPASVTSTQTANAWLQSNPQKVWYQSSAYTEDNDIPVQLETHASAYSIYNGAEPGWTSLNITTGWVQIGIQAGAKYTSNDAVPDVVSDIFTARSINDVYSTKSSGVSIDSNGRIRISFASSDFPSVNSLETALEYLSDNAASFVYPLTSPAVYARDPATLVAVPYTAADVTAANQLANTPSTLPNIDSPDVPMLLDSADNTDSAAQVMALAANAVPVAGTYVVSSQDGTTVAVSLKAMQDGGDAATLGGMTLDEIKQLISDMIAAATSGN